MYYDQRITQSFADLTGSFDEMKADEPYPGVSRLAFSTERATVTKYTFAPGARFPRHRHPQEQITVVQRGVVRFTVGDTVLSLVAGSWSVVPPDVEHGLEADEDGAEVLALIVPRREHDSAYSVVEAGGTAT
jgi:quercetin dioxygenase-like cupin family protein